MLCAILTVGRSSGLVTQHKGHSGVGRKGMAVGIGRSIWQTNTCGRRKNAIPKQWRMRTHQHLHGFVSIVSTDTCTASEGKSE